MLADLGIARARGERDDGRVRGTPGYMAPEQSRGQPVDARSDVCSLGVTLVELATGRRATNRTFDRDVCADAADGTDLPGAVARWLAPAVGRCLETDPRDRWPDMGALATALRALEVDGPGLREALGIPAVLDALASPGILVLKGPAGIGRSPRSSAHAPTDVDGRPSFDVRRSRENAGYRCARGLKRAAPEVRVSTPEAPWNPEVVEPPPSRWVRRRSTPPPARPRVSRPAPTDPGPPSPVR